MSETGVRKAKMPSSRRGQGKVGLFRKCVNERAVHPGSNLLPPSEWKGFVTAARVRFPVNSFPWEHQQAHCLADGHC